MSGVLRIAVVDGQGGGIGKALVEKLRREYGEKIEILALGTNAAATAQMLKSGADEGATGENAVCLNAGRVDIITGAVGIIMANAMLGELTPAMSVAIASSNAHKILIPINRCNLELVGITDTSLPQQILQVVQAVGRVMTKEL